MSLCELEYPTQWLRHLQTTKTYGGSWAHLDVVLWLASLSGLKITTEKWVRFSLGVPYFRRYVSFKLRLEIHNMEKAGQVLSYHGTDSDN